MAFDAYPPGVQDQARARMALLGSLCAVAAGPWVRTQVDGGSEEDGFLPWHGLKKRYTLRQQLTTVGFLERIMS